VAKTSLFNLKIEEYEKVRVAIAIGFRDVV
jgi:hypothetical protein